jgi:hypothetical protein
MRRPAQNVAAVHIAPSEFNFWIIRRLRPLRSNSEASAKERRNRGMAGPSTLTGRTQPDQGAASITDLDGEAIRIRITRWTGSQTDGFVFAACGPIIRVAIPGHEDAEQFWCRDGYWYSEDGEAADIDFFAAEGYDYGFPKAMMSDECSESSLWGIPTLAWIQ